MRGAGAASLVAAVAAAETIGRPAPAQAGTDGDVVLGSINNSPTETVINCTDVVAFAVDATASDSVGLKGTCSGGGGIGVVGTAGGGVGVQGNDTGGGTAVDGNSGNAISSFGAVGNGVHGITASATGIGVLGENASGTAVGGISSTSDGVGGTSSSGTGVHGVSSTGTGVRGEGGSGTGVLATGATALSVQGPAVFSRSGMLTVAAGKSSATQAGVALTAASLVLATLQQHTTGVSVAAAVPNVSGSLFTVYLNKTVTAPVRVAWFIVN
jgi:hypothetical protein